MKVSRAALVLLVFLPSLSFAQPVAADLFSGLAWRNIGPFRGGRTRAIAGVPSQPNVFYIGPVNGGVWKTNDYGRTWSPLFDNQPTGSIGAIAVAPSDPNIVYVGSGEGLQRPDLSVGDGVYKSTDAGRSWTHLGLRESQQIPQVAVDPRNPDRLFVAVLGHPYGPNTERGIFRSTDGGQSFQKVLYKDENTGGSDVVIDPANPNTVYAALWETRQGPWENAAWTGAGGLFKSTDGGDTWSALANGLPPGVSQVNIALAPSRPQTLYLAAAVGRSTGLFRSNDAGASWTRITTDPRPAARIGGGDLPVLSVDPKDPETVYSASVVAWRSTDGGKTWTALRGAPGGDDYQRFWINPHNTDILAVASDQGAVISVNRGQTWSSWYNQSTAALYHVNADNAFPYRLCGGQQDSGSVCISSRGNDGQITFREWSPVGVEEYGYAVPDPLDPDIVVGGKLTRYNRRTGQIENILPRPLRPAGFRVLRTAPVVFSPADPRALYFASNSLWTTRDSGRSWREISPDLSRKTWQLPASVGKYAAQDTAQPTQRGVIYAVAPSPLQPNRIWAGTDDGLIHLTTDGGLHWTNVTPPQLAPWFKVSILEAGHFDPQTAYAAINTLRLDRMEPVILKTHDAGRTWTPIVNGIPEGAPVNVVREDPRKKGLLFAGTERAVYVSFDDGLHWQSLRRNMPAGSVRDLIVKGDDLIAATHGRGFWILDNITPLRQFTQLTPAQPAVLFRPQTALRIRWNMNPDTPLPPDEPAGKNPPPGAILDYFLGPATTGPVTLEITDSAGRLVRRFSSDDPLPPLDPLLEIPLYWVRPPAGLSNLPGMHRFLWDLHTQPLPAAKQTYPIQAVVHETAPESLSYWVLPGTYTVKFTANGKTYSQPLAVQLDPRVHVAPDALRRQFELSRLLFLDLTEARALARDMETARAQTHNPAFQNKLDALLGQPAARGARSAPPAPETLNSVSAQITQLLLLLQQADAAPTAQLLRASADRRAALSRLRSQWKALKALPPP